MTLLAHRIETVLQQDGTLTLEQLPFQAGQAVEVIILPHAGGKPTSDPYPLHGSIIRFDRPTDSVAEDEWEMLK